MKRWLVLVAFMAVLTAFATPAVAAKPGNVKMMTAQSAAIVVGDTTWLAFTWQADGDLKDFRVTVDRSDGADFRYPENTATYSGPYQSTDLTDGEIDYTAVRLHVPEASKAASGKSLNLQLDASWEANGRTHTSHHTVKVPLAVYTGDDVAQVTDSVQVEAGHGAWVEIAYAGLAPLIERFSVVVASDATVPVTYPGYRTETSLHHDAALERGETDVVRFFVDAADLTPGVITLKVFASYARGGQPGGLEGDLTVAVVP